MRMTGVLQGPRGCLGGGRGGSFSRAEGFFARARLRQFITRSVIATVDGIIGRKGWEGKKC